MPDDSIMDLVDNVEVLYNAKLQVFDRWISLGDTWDERLARKKALFYARRFSERLKQMGLVSGRYKKADLNQFVDEILAEFHEYRDYKIKEATQRQRAPKPAAPMTQGDIEYAEKYEGLAQRIGIDILKGLVPASAERVRKAIETGDLHLNTIPLRHWDAAAGFIHGASDLSLSEKVGVLKHVAKWHYA